MGRELGRISGPLLSANLERDGVDLRFEDDLLYLSVVDTANPSKKVGIGINSVPTNELSIDNTIHTTNLVVDTRAYVGLTGSQFTFIDNKIQYEDTIGAIDKRIILQPNQSSDPTITTTKIGTKDYSLSVNYLNISDKLIENLSNNSNIQLTPSITGITQFDTSEVYVNGSLESTGNITFDGDITFGSDASDNVDFKADINSHIIPNITNTYDLGSTLQRWANVYVHGLYANNTSVTSQTFNTLIANGTSSFDGNAYLGNASTDHITFTSLLDNSLIPTTSFNALGIKVGPLVSWNTLFLTELDVDGTVNIVNNTITTLTTDTDLSLSAAGTGKIVVTNTDVEITNDLTVDQLTTLTNIDITGLLDLTGDYTWTQTGIALRTGNTDITGSLTVNGAHTVQFDDIKFVSNRITTTLPSSNLVLIANGSGIIKTTVTDVEITNDLNVDLTGDFNTVNATTVYANAYDIGSIYIVDNTITTNVLNTNLVLSADGAGEIHVTTTDVEITNDLTVNSTSTLSDVIIGGAGTGLSIVTAGLQLYLDANNSSSYPGTGTTWYDLSSNHNDVEMQNSGSISFNSGSIKYFNTGSDGWFSKASGTNLPVGDDPYTLSVWVQLGASWGAQGLVSIGPFFNGNESNAFRTDSTNSYLNYWWGNDLYATSSLSPATQWFNAVAKYDGTTRSIWINGVLASYDTPGAVHNVTSSDLQIAKTVASEYLNGNIGQVLTYNVALSDAEILQNYNATVSAYNGSPVSGPANLYLTGNWDQTGTAHRTGNTDITGSLTVNGANTVQFDDIQFFGNVVKTTLGTDLELQANGTGIVKILTSDVEITNDLDVLDTGYINEVVVINGVDPSDASVDFNVGNISISGNTVTTSTGNLILSADGAGKLHVTTTDVEITNDLEVNQLTTLADVSITGLLDLTGDYTWTQTGAAHRTGNTDITGSLTVNGAHTVQFDDIQFVGNVVRTTLGTDLELQANGTGIVKILTNDVEITNDLDVTLHGEINTVNATTVTANAYNITDVYITGNSITTDFLNRDLELSADGAGRIYVTTTNVEITNNLNVDTATTLADVGITGLLDLTGDYTWTQTGIAHRTGNTDITGSLTVNGANTVQFENIKFLSNSITTTVTDSDLTLTADLTKEIHVTTTDVEITNDLAVDDTGYFNTVEAGTVVADSFDIGSVYVTGNSITTNTTNTNLVLEADGTGTIYIPLTDVAISNDLTVAGPLTVNGDTSLKNTVIRSETLTPTVTQVSQNLSGTTGPVGFFFYGWQILHPGQTEPTFSAIQPGWSCVEIPGSVVTAVGDGITDYTITMSFGLFASGGTYSFIGDVVSYGPATLTQTGNIDQTGNTYVTGTFTNNGPITITGVSSYLSGPEIKIQNHKIKVTAVDTDLEFVGAGSGGIVLDSKLKFKDSTISNVWATPTTDTQKSIIFDPDGTGNVVIDSAISLTIPYGNSSNQVLNAIGQIRQNSTTGHYEGWSPSGLVSFTGIYDSDSNTYITPELTFGANDNIIRFGINGVVKQEIDVTKLSNNTIHVDNISISNNSISNLISSNNLEINVTGAGVVNINNVLVKDNTITNVNNSALILESTGTGYVKFGGTGGVVFPAGVDADRRVTPDLGEIRYNTQHNYTEIWDGDSWVAVSGSAAAATEEEVTAETNLWAFVLG